MNEMELVQKMVLLPSLDAGDDALGCRYMRCAAAKSKENDTDANRMEKEESCTAAGDDFEMTSFEVYRALCVLLGRLLLCIRSAQICFEAVNGFFLIGSPKSLK